MCRVLFNGQFRTSEFCYPTLAIQQAGALFCTHLHLPQAGIKQDIPNAWVMTKQACMLRKHSSIIDALFPPFLIDQLLSRSTSWKYYVLLSRGLEWQARAEIKY